MEKRMKSSSKSVAFRSALICFLMAVSILLAAMGVRLVALPVNADTSFDSVEVYDYYDLTGGANVGQYLPTGTAASEIGRLPSDKNNAMRMKMVLPSPFTEEIQFGTFAPEGADHIWYSNSIIVGFWAGHVRISLMDATQSPNPIEKGSAEVDDIRAGSQITFEIGSKKQYENSEYIADYIYVTINGEEVIGWSNTAKTELGTRFITPYFSSGAVVLKTAYAEAVSVTEDFYDLTGENEILCDQAGVYTAALGRELSANLNVAFKTKITMPEAPDAAGMQIGVFNVGDPHIWVDNSLILRIREGYLGVFYVNTLLADCVNVPEIAASSTFELEIGIVKGIARGENYFGNIIYVKINGDEILSYTDVNKTEFGKKLMYPYQEPAPNIRMSTTYTLELETPQIVDIHDITGLAENTYTTVGCYSATIGEFPTNVNVAFKAKMTLPSSFSDAGIKLALFSSGVNNFWEGKGRIVRFAPQTLLLSDQTDANHHVYTGVEALTAGNTFELEIGYVRATFGKTVSNATYVKIDGVQIGLHLGDASEELGTKLFYPYLDPGSPSLILETAKTVGTVNFRVENGTASGLDFVSGSGTIVTLNPDSGTFLRSITKNGEPFTDYTLEGGEYKIEIADPNASDEWRAEFAVPVRDDVSVSDIADLTGYAEKYFYSAADSTQIGTLSWLNTGFRTKMNLSLTNDFQAMKFGIWQGDDRVQMWGTKGFIVRFNPNDGTIHLADAGETLLASCSVEGIFDGEEFLFEIGAAKGYVDDEYVCNVVYIEIDGTEVIRYIDAEKKEHGSALLAPYMTAGSTALYVSAKQTKTFTVNANRATVIGNSYVEGGNGAVLYLKPESGYMLASFTKNGEGVTGFTSTADGMIILAIGTPSESDIYSAEFASISFDEVQAYDLYDITGKTSFEFTRSADSWDLGNVPWLNTAFKTKINIGETTPGIKFAAFIQTYDRLYMWGSHEGTTGMIIRLGNGTVILANDGEVPMAIGTHVAVVSGGEFVLEIGAKKAYAGDEWVANYIYIAIDGTEVVHYVDYSKVERGTIIMTPYMDNETDRSSFKTTYTQSNLTIRTAEGIALGEEIPAFADRAYTLDVPMAKGYVVTGVTLNGTDVMQNLSEVKGYGYVLKIAGGIPDGSELVFTTEKISYNISITAPDHASAFADKGETVLKNDSVVFTLKPEKGYRISSVTLNGEDVTALLVPSSDAWTLEIETVEEALSLSFTVEALTYTVTLPQVELGTVTADKTSVPAGGSVTITVTPDEGYFVKEVKINGETVRINGDGTYTVSQVLEDLTVEVSFELKEVENITEPKGGCGSSLIEIPAAAVMIFAAVVVIIAKKRGTTK